MTKDTGAINWEGQTLLIAEDDPMNYKIVEQQLKPTQIKIIWAETGEEVLFFLKHPELNIDAVLMDIRMPDLDGIRATKLLKEQYPGIPVIMHSAYSQLPEYADYNELFDGKLPKPVKREMLLQTLNRHLSPAIEHKKSAFEYKSAY